MESHAQLCIYGASLQWANLLYSAIVMHSNKTVNKLTGLFWDMDIGVKNNSSVDFEFLFFVTSI